MSYPSVAHLVRRHVRLHAAQHILELYSVGQPYTDYLRELSPEMRRAVEGLLRATAESWGIAVSDLERAENGDGQWLR